MHADGLKLQMYDLRYPPTHQQSPNSNPTRHAGHNKNRNESKRKHTQSNCNTPTKPYLVFPDYSPTYTPEYDLSTELGLLASGTFFQFLIRSVLMYGEQYPTKTKSNSSPSEAGS